MIITERNFGMVKIVNIFFVEEQIPPPDYDVVTYHTNINWGEIPGFGRKQVFTLTIDLNQSTDAIWKNFNRDRRRQIIRAEEDGTKITLSNKYEEYNQLYKQFLKRKCYCDPSGLDVLSSKFMQKYGVLFTSDNQGEMMGGYLYLHDTDTALPISIAYQDFGNSIEKKRLISDANSYLQWAAMQYFKNLGVITYDFGGINGNGTNINQKINGVDFYKRSFGGEVISQYQYMKFNSHFYKLLFHSWNFFLRPHA